MVDKRKEGKKNKTTLNTHTHMPSDIFLNSGASSHKKKLVLLFCCQKMGGKGFSINKTWHKNALFSYGEKGESKKKQFFL